MHLRQTSPVEKMFNEVKIPSFLEFRSFYSGSVAVAVVIVINSLISGFS